MPGAALDSEDEAKVDPAPSRLPWSPIIDVLIS